MDIFFGIPVDLLGAQRHFASKLAPMNLIGFEAFPRESLHITLWYIQDPTEQTVQQCIEILTELQTRKFCLRVGTQLHYLANRKLVYADVEDVEGDLRSLRKEIRESLLRRDITIDQQFEPRDFHVSLGRWSPTLETSGFPDINSHGRCVLQVDTLALLQKTEESRVYRKRGWERLLMSEREAEHRTPGNPEEERIRTGHPTAA